MIMIAQKDIQDLHIDDKATLREMLSKLPTYIWGPEVESRSLPDYLDPVNEQCYIFDAAPLVSDQFPEMKSYAGILIMEKYKAGEYSLDFQGIKSDISFSLTQLEALGFTKAQLDTLCEQTAAKDSEAHANPEHHANANTTGHDGRVDTPSKREVE